MKENFYKIKPYYFLRDKVLHVRYNVDEAMKLSDAEADRIKAELDEGGAGCKQDVLARNWQVFEGAVGKETFDGTRYANEKMARARQGKQA